MRPSSRKESDTDIPAAAALMFLWLACASSPATRPSAPASGAAVAVCASSAPAARPGDVESQLINIKAKIMSADYRADLEELERGRRLALPLERDPALGYLAHYWAGYAGWRAALNGANHGMTRPALITNLETADGEFRAALIERPAFADACAAAASIEGWLGTLYSHDPKSMLAHYKEEAALLHEAMQLQPDNPRVLWVAGGDAFSRPAVAGGDQQLGIQLYRRALEKAGEPDGASPLPDWGKVEALMALAWAHLNLPVPDAATAREEAREALRLRPDWSYVRDILLPQIGK